MCRFSIETLVMTVETYFNRDYVTEVLDSNDRTLGIQRNLTVVDINSRLDSNKN